MTEQDFRNLSIHVHNYGQSIPYDNYCKGKNASSIVMDELMSPTYNGIFLVEDPNLPEAPQWSKEDFEKKRDIQLRDRILLDLVHDKKAYEYIRNDEKNTAKAYKTFLNSIYGINGVKAKMNSTIIKNVYFSGPCTIVIWADGTKTIVRQNMEKDPIFDAEKGLALAIAKHFMGTNENKSNYYNIFHKWLPKAVNNSTPITNTVEHS